MKFSINVPRVFLPRENFLPWSAPACSSFPRDRARWETMMQNAGEFPSAIHCILPDALAEDETKARIHALQKCICVYLEKGYIERLNRGMILVERKTSYGTRRGLLASIDLEELSAEGIFRPTAKALPEIVDVRLQARRASLLEFPHAVLLYRDKRNKILRSVDDDLELLYDFERAGGRVAAYFIPNDDAQFLAFDLLARSEVFAVADGNHALAAAKAYWEEIKAPLSLEERENHPARFTLVELVNLFDESVVFEPYHRVIKEVETEAFCSFFMKNVKCKREKNVLIPALSKIADYEKTDEIIRTFVKQNFGRVEYRSEPYEMLGAEEDCVVVVMAPVDRELLFAAAERGKVFPAKTFRLGAEEDARYCIEGREITYD